MHRYSTAQEPCCISAPEGRNFQQEYRDYLDMAKMAQMIPIIGAPAGVIVNNRLIKKLENTAMNAYRMRLFDAAKSINKIPPNSL